MKRKKRVIKKQKINLGLMLSAGSIVLIVLAFLALEIELNNERQNTDRLEQDIFEVNKYLFNNDRQTNVCLSALGGRLDQDYFNLNSRIDVLDKDLQEATETLAEGFKKNYFYLLDNTDELNRLKKAVNRNQAEMIKKMILPSVRIKTDDNVGGGTIVYSRPGPDNNYHTYILTAYHVIQEAIEKKKQNTAQSPSGGPETTIKVYAENDDTGTVERVAAGEPRPDGPKETGLYQAEIVSAHKSKDLALLKIKSAQPFPAQARLITREKIARINIFSPVYVMGCPLGYDPLPTYGEITSLKREMNGEEFWMTNAPTIFGNSGGGIFLGETGEFIGVSSMVSVYTNFISIPIPHLSLIVSPESILDWLDEQFYQFIYDENYTKEWCDAMREQAQENDPTLAAGLNQPK